MSEKQRAAAYDDDAEYRITVRRTLPLAALMLQPSQTYKVKGTLANALADDIATAEKV